MIIRVKVKLFDAIQSALKLSCINMTVNYFLSFICTDLQSAREAFIEFVNFFDRAR